MPLPPGLTALAKAGAVLTRLAGRSVFGITPFHS
jgi:hypothetical protein